MWCTTECWDCEDRKCEHYISKTELYFENKKLKNYHYENIANEFIKTGITFDLVENLTDSVIREYLLDKENKK